MAVKLLSIGDIHLGRRIGRVPADLGEIRVADAWRIAAHLAMEREVDGIILAGDVVDRTDDRFEAYGHLAREVERLVAAGIRVFAVAGNHDVEALPRLARHIPQVTLLGAGGRWSLEEIEGRSGGSALLLGWSYAEERVRRNPLEDLPSSLAGETRPVLGVLHCTVNGGREDPAPVPRAEL
ncbi:MAG: metallophosphoesterase, partial [Planctomycetes bacterium]|nr:metallophosphoesterase [Planctomycetota bacterium]